MHNVLWQAYDAEMKLDRVLPDFLRNRQLVAPQGAARRRPGGNSTRWSINRDEFENYTRSILPASKPIFYTPMGVNSKLALTGAGEAPRVAYYGGMGAKRNRKARSGVPRCDAGVWRKFPKPNSGSSAPAARSDPVRYQ